MLDAREYYPKNFDDSLRWRILTKPINEYLCDNYLHRCDQIITVSDGLAKKYTEEYRIRCPEVVMSLPYSYSLEPVKNESDKIRIIYHGNANPSRKTEVMVEMMDFVDKRFTLDLMLMKSNPKYWNKIKDMVKGRNNVRVIPPVAVQEIIPFINSYDIGIFLCPPTNFNLKYALPNKLFEFIQARLAIAIGPSIEMQKIVTEYDCGIVSKSFEPRSLAEEINQLTPEKLTYYKEQSHKAAQELHADVNKEKVQHIVQKLLDD